MRSPRLPDRFVPGYGWVSASTWRSPRRALRSPSGNCCTKRTEKGDLGGRAMTQFSAATLWARPARVATDLSRLSFAEDRVHPLYLARDVMILSLAFRREDRLLPDLAERILAPLALVVATRPGARPWRPRARRGRSQGARSGRS